MMLQSFYARTSLAHLEEGLLDLRLLPRFLFALRTVAL